MWKRLHRRIVSVKGYQLVRPSKAKITAALREFEQVLGTRLPKRYKAFIHEFGPGELVS